MAAPIRSNSPMNLPTDPRILEQQRQILELQKQVLEMQVLQQQQVTNNLAAKVPLIKMQLDDINRRADFLDEQIRGLRAQLQIYKSNSISIAYPRGHAVGETTVGKRNIDPHERPMALQARHDYTNLEIFQKEYNELQARKKSLENQIQELLK